MVAHLFCISIYFVWGVGLRLTEVAPLPLKAIPYVN